jgi:ABC transporter substrate binding protein/Phage integrase family
MGTGSCESIHRGAMKCIASTVQFPDRQAKRPFSTLRRRRVACGVSKADEVLTAAQALAAKNVEAFFISTDSMVVSALESLVKVANATKIPLFGNDPRSYWDVMKDGEVAAIPKPQRRIHALRHIRAVHLLDAGADVAFVQDRLGHASIRNKPRQNILALAHFW